LKSEALLDIADREGDPLCASLLEPTIGVTP
jgi:hypothetical protein